MDFDEKIMVRPAWMSLVMGILAFPAVFVPFLSVFLSAAFSVAGIGSGVQAIGVIRSDPSSYSGMGLAIGGLVVSAIGAAILVPWVVVLLLGLVMGGLL